MAYKKQLRDKNGNVVYPDVGLDLDDVVYSDDPTEEFDSIIDPNSYSLSEKLTGGYWVDGKPIYKKTINFGTLPNNSTKNVSHGVANLRQIIRIGGIAYRSSNDTFAPLPATAGGPIYLFANATNIQITTTSDRTDFLESFVTIYYTKTTD